MSLHQVSLWDQLEDLPALGQHVGQLKYDSVSGQVLGKLRMTFLCQVRLWAS